MSAGSQTSTWTADDEDKLVRPKAELCSLLQHVGATKEVFTMKEVMFYLGQYILQKQLYDQRQQHIVHCGQDALGQVLGVDSFSVKEPQVLFAMLTKNLVAVRNKESTSLSKPHSSSPMDRGTEAAGAEARSSSPDRRTCSCRSSEQGPSHSIDDGIDEEEEDEEGRKRRRSDSYSLTSCYAIGGRGSGQDKCSSQPSDSHNTSGRSEVRAAASDSDSDNFSVEYEVESTDSSDYNEDDHALSAAAADEVYEVTVFEVDDDDDDDDDSFDEDTEITEADFCCCAKCYGLNPPLHGNGFLCWTLRQDRPPESSIDCAASGPKAPPMMSASQSAAKEAPGSDMEQSGLDVPDGERLNTPPLHMQCASNSDSSAPNSQDLLSCAVPSSSSSYSQEKLWTPDSQPPSTSYSSSVNSLVLLPSAPSPVAAARPSSVPAEWRLPDSCLDPCLICQSRPKNGCIVHGRTGHLMCCYVCARKLKKRNKPCPVCRLPIQSVILTYLS